jgi:hypothetical protein
MYQGTKVCRMKESCRCNLWPGPCDLETLTTEDFWLIFGGRMYQGTTVCRVKESCWCELWPWLCDLETEIPFRSVSPKRMRIFIFDWYMVWGCIGGQRCVGQKICVDVTFDHDPNCIIFPFRSIITKRLKMFGWYLVGGCIRGQRCVARKNRVDASFDLDSVTLKPKFPSVLYLLNEWRFSVDIWCEDVSEDKDASGKRFVSMWPWPQIA